MKKRHRILASVLLFLYQALTTNSHSFMIHPPADWKMTQKAECRIGGPNGDPQHCAGPCIPTDSHFYKKDAAHTTWRRGDRVPVRWTRNNHRHGFVRLALVPLHQRMSKDAHTRYAFHFACWESKKERCNDAEYFCGTDIDLFTTKVTVPDVPDGDYVLGWTWFGAYEGYGKWLAPGRYNYGDYWSCAYIKVVGGTGKHERSPKHMPDALSQEFDAGPGKKGGCWSMTDSLGKCKREPCATSSLPGLPVTDDDGEIELKRPPQFLMPAGFANPRPKRTAQSLQSRKWAECGCRKPKRKSGPYVANLMLFRLKADGRREKRCTCLGNKATVPRSAHGITIVAQVVGKTSAVRFFVNGKLVQTEKHAPYAIAGNVGDKFVEFRPGVFKKPLRISADVVVKSKLSSKRFNGGKRSKRSLFGGGKRSRVTFLKR